MWHHLDQGEGRPLVLLHGIGMSHFAWTPVLPQLVAERRVIAFDIAGFGATPALPPGTAPNASNLVDALAGALAGQGVHEPVDIAGNSLGGQLAIEAAHRGLARSVVAISPAGLWREAMPRHAAWLFLALRAGCRHFPGLVAHMLHLPWLRELMFALPIGPGSRHMPVADALRIVREFSRAPGFDATLAAMDALPDSTGLATPLTVVFGERDWLLPSAARDRSRLPSHTRWETRPDWGHVPMWRDPQGVARLLLEGTAG